MRIQVTSDVGIDSVTHDAAHDASHSEAFTWTSADLGTPRVDLEDKEAVQRILDEHESRDRDDRRFSGIRVEDPFRNAPG